MQVKTYIEKQRGSGYKKPGKYYLIGASAGFPTCNRFPQLLVSCHCCGTKFNFNSTLTWINSNLFTAADPKSCSCDICRQLLAGQHMGLLWASTKHYPFIIDFEREAAAIGISLQLSAVPAALQPGTWLSVAHNKAVPVINSDPAAGPASDLVSYLPGVFYVFQLEKIQYVITATDPAEKLQDLQDKKIELIQVEREGTPIKLF